MGIQAKRLPEHGVTVVIWSGRLTPEEIRRHIGGLDAVYSDRFLQYWDPSADLSGVNIAAIPELKRLLADKLKALYGDKRAVSAVVRDPAMKEQFPQFWPSYVSADHGYPAQAVAFSSLEAACAWLNLTDDGGQAVIDALEDLQGSKRGSGPEAPIGAAGPRSGP
jgi:hypothetical protein